MATTKKGGSIKKVDGLSLDIQKEKIDALKKLVPEAFSDGKIDAEKLKQVIGESNVAGDERYRLEWSGKSEVFDEIAKRSACTLTLDEKRSSNDWKDSNNVFVEGENLEVLRTLQKAYHGKVKMIYIDPPYNTGKDFVYNDNFRETEDEYCDDECNVDKNGYLKKAYKLNSRDGGRFHSNWLSMIYPRLYLARNLLRDDGVIFVSIDDNEVSNLQLILSEIFGEENFIAKVVIEGAFKNDARQIGINHDYCLVFAKNRDKLPREWSVKKEAVEPVLKQVELLKKEYGKDYSAASEDLAVWFRNNKAKPAYAHRRFRFIDERGAYKEDDPTAPGGRKFDLINPKNKKIIPLRKNRGWGFDQETFNQMVGEGRISFISEDSIMVRRYLHETDGSTPQSVIYLASRSASERLNNLIGGNFFEYPKDENMLAQLVSMATEGEDIVLDFFSGSGTTAHAVMKQNAEDGCGRRYISVQMPEETPDGSEARKAGYKKISEIAIDRITKAAAKIKKEKPDFKGDLGVRVYKETDSHFPQWHARAFESDEELKQAMIDYNKKGLSGSAHDRATEVLLKLGYPLTTPLEEKKGYFVTPDNVVLALDSLLNIETLKKVVADSPKVIVVLEKLFKKDEDKINFSLRCKEAGVIFQTV